MNKAKLLVAVLLTLGAAGAAHATKAKAFMGYVYSGGVYTSVYVPYDCPETGYGCIYTSWNGNTYQVYMQSGIQFYPVKP
ncbi:hypothetical protein SAMN05428988_4939 [Chitinophaga sp. YR573]|uniref:hypothetical protein n=1 Tax=Chitinophaga sp. YR573 TaxID=1881040 RepID=UPI0008CFF853|nr:hypothetical protein [Chitinophaga sp. YR573]SEW38882.1 hypothetical protein SAMN05428988_4939 [Chitinophaga sp. YR573]